MYGSARSVGHAEDTPAQSPRLPRTPRMGHQRGSASSRGSMSRGGGKTLSMENIQSLNAAYAASGPVYLSDHEALSSFSCPKVTMTLGRATGRAPFGRRATFIGSSPNISSSLDSVGYGDHRAMPLLQLQHQGALSPLLRQVMRSGVRGEAPPVVEQLKELQRENYLLRRELDVKDSKLSSSVNSIKGFWSPELKKERGMRKEESAKMSILKEQMRVTDEENQHLQMTIQALQEELHTQRDLNELLHNEKHADQQGSTSDPSPILELTEDNFHHLQAEHKRQAKELFLLRKTLEEMELRIESQKQTLSARDESIKRLLEMLQNKDLSRSEMPNEEGLRVGRETEEQLGYLEVILEQKEEENMHLREELYQRSQQTDHAKTKALHTAIDMKDSKIASLERNIRDLEDEIQMLRFSGLLNADDKDKELKQMEAYKSHSRLMKNKDPFMQHVSLASPRGNNRFHDQTFMLPQQHKMDQLKQDLSKKESEMLALQTKLETLANQNSDCKQHIEVLKESLSAKEQRASILQSEVDALRLRLEEKETFLNKKIKQLQDLADEKSTMSGEIHDLKDMLDVKECKISVLQKKIENLLEQVRDKDKQMESLKDRVTSLQTDSSNTDTAFATLEEALAEKDKLIEQLKEHRHREVQEKNVEMEVCKTENKALKDKIASLQAQFLEKESSLLELRERISSLTSSGLQKDSRLRALESSLERRVEECSWLEGQLRKNELQGKSVKALESNEAARTNLELSEQVKTLEVALQKDESASKVEVGQLQAVHREAGTEQMKDKLPEPERQDNTTPLAEIKPTSALQQVQQPPVNQVLAGQVLVQEPARQVPVEEPAGQVLVQALAGQVPVQALAGQVPLQEPAGQVPLQALAGQVPVQEPAGQVPQQALAGQVPVQTLAGQVPVQEPAGQVPLQALAGQVPVQEPAGQVPLQALAGHVLVQEPAGQVPLQALAGHVLVQEPAGQVPLQALAGQVPLQALAGHVPVQEPAGQVPLQALAGHVLVQEPAGQVPLQALAGQVLVQEPAGQVPLQALAGQVPVQEPAGQVLVQEPAGQVPLQALAGQVPLQALAGQVPLQELAGQVPLQALTGQVPLQVLAGQVPVQVLSGQVPLQEPAGQIPLQALAGQVPVQALAGQVPVQALAGQVMVQALAGQVPVQEPTGQVSLQALAGQVPVQALAGQVPLQTLTGQVPVHTLAGQILLQEQAGQVPLQALAGQVPVQALAGQVPLQALSGQVPLQALAGQVPLQALAGQVPLQALAGQVLVQEPAGQVPLQALAGQVPLQALAGQVPLQALMGQVSLQETPGQVPVQALAGQIPVQEPAGQVPLHKSAGQVPLQALAGQVSTQDMAGQVPGQEPAGKVLVQEPAKEPKGPECVLQESMTTSAPIKATVLQEEQPPTVAPAQREELMSALDKARQELDVTRQRLLMAQDCLADRENQLICMKQEQRKQLDDMHEFKHQALLAAISEKDANIALLELSAPSMLKQDEVMALRREKDILMFQLKQQTQSRMKLIAENYENGHLHPHHSLHPHHGHLGVIHHHGPPRGPPSHTSHYPQLEQDDEEGIWA